LAGGAGALEGLSEGALTGSPAACRPWVTFFLLPRLRTERARGTSPLKISYVLWIDRDYTGALETNFRALCIHRELDGGRGEDGVIGN